MGRFSRTRACTAIIVAMVLLAMGAPGCSPPAAQSPDERVVAELRPRFTRCYNKEPPVTGAVTVRAELGPGGEVERADAVNVTGLSWAVADCIANAVRTARFEPPRGDDRTIHIPMKFDGP
jgi:hypothetical protein